MAPSTFSGLRVVLFPYIPCPFALLEDIVDDVRPQFGIDLLGFLPVRSLHSGILLLMVFKEVQTVLEEKYILREVR